MLVLARRRVREGWERDPQDGGFDAPAFERATAVGCLGSLALWFAALVALLSTRGPTLWALLGAALVVSTSVVLRRRAHARRVRARRRESDVLPAALVVADEHLDRPGRRTHAAVVVWSTDERVANEPEALVELARRIAGELKPDEGRRGRPGAAVDAVSAVSAVSAVPAVPAELEPLARRLTSGEPSWERVRVPESWCGLPGAWASDVRIFRHDLPAGRIDRRVFLVAAHPSEPQTPLQLLPKRFWWRDDTDELLRSVGLAPAAPRA